MDVSLVILLVAILALAALLYYVFLVKQTPDPGGKGGGGLITIVFILVAVVVFAIWNQSTADDRLNKVGFKHHPALRSSVGFATGLGEDPVWVFALDGDPGQIMQFYKTKDNYTGWQLVYQGKNMLVYENEAQSLSIFVAEDDVIFALNSKR